MHPELRQLFRFLLAGVFNTGVGYTLILLFQFITGQAVLANFLGYTVSGGISYLSHSRFTFKERQTPRNAITFTGLLIACYLVNLIVLRLMLQRVNPEIAQAIAVASFVVLSYVGQSKIVFASGPEGR